MTFCWYVDLVYFSGNFIIWSMMWKSFSRCNLGMWLLSSIIFMFCFCKKFCSSLNHLPSRCGRLIVVFLSWSLVRVEARRWWFVDVCWLGLGCANVWWIRVAVEFPAHNIMDKRLCLGICVHRFLSWVVCCHNIHFFEKLRWVLIVLISWVVFL